MASRAGQGRCYGNHAGLADLSVSPADPAGKNVPWIGLNSLPNTLVQYTILHFEKNIRVVSVKRVFAFRVVCESQDAV